MLTALDLVQCSVFAQDERFELLAGTDDLTRPVYLTYAGDARLFIVEQRGVIRNFAEGELLEAPFLQIEEVVDDRFNEEGLLSLAFDPDYMENGYFYVNYTAADSTTRIVRYHVSADPTSAEIILTISQPYGNHNGGVLKFGSDGYLYIGMGDGGAADDPENRAQNRLELLGKFLRIDVSQSPYAIPEDNPFVDDSTARPEICAYGLRNPWRFSFDRQTGDLYIADVGQNWIEEVNFQPAKNQGGENYGWRLFEGNDTHINASSNREEFVFPVVQYTHDDGCSVGIVWQFPPKHGRISFDEDQF